MILTRQQKKEIKERIKKGEINKSNFIEIFKSGNDLIISPLARNLKGFNYCNILKVSFFIPFLNKQVIIDLNIYMKKGNKKIPNNTIIINISDALINCYASNNKICNMSKICYAKKSELLYFSPLICNILNYISFNFIKYTFFNTKNIFYFNKLINHIKEGIINSKKEIKAIRFNESGEISDKKDILMLNMLISILNKDFPTLKQYTYTHNKGALKEYLKSNKLNKNFNINLSFKDASLKMNQYKGVNDISNIKFNDTTVYCTCDCKNCRDACGKIKNYCLTNNNLTIIVKNH